MKKEIAYFLLGSNVGDRYAHLASARQKMGASIGTIINKSAIYDTAPWGYKDQAHFLNQAVCLETEADPFQTLKKALEIQYNTDWKKGSKYGPRLLDIDLIFYGNRIIRTDELWLPHPRMHKRNFVLIPLVEIAGDVVHPVLKKTVRELAQACQDREEVTVYVHNGD